MGSNNKRFIINLGLLVRATLRTCACPPGKQRPSCAQMSQTENRHAPILDQGQNFCSDMKLAQEIHA
jgi:hypothetical protein